MEDARDIAQRVERSEAIEGCLSIDVKHVPLAEGDQVREIEL